MMKMIENPVLVSVKFQYVGGYESEFVIREAAIPMYELEEFFYYDEEEEEEVLNEEEFEETLYELFNVDKKRYYLVKFEIDYPTNIMNLYK